VWFFCIISVRGFLFLLSITCSRLCVCVCVCVCVCAQWKAEVCMLMRRHISWFHFSSCPCSLTLQIMSIDQYLHLQIIAWYYRPCKEIAAQHTSDSKSSTSDFFFNPVIYSCKYVYKCVCTSIVVYMWITSRLENK
jgi:hypothetical protein